MNSRELSDSIRQQTQKRAYIDRLAILEQSPNLLKARLYISSDLFVQVYRNDQYDTTNLVLIHNSQRIYGRDQLGGLWHRHTAVAPHLHDTSDEGSRAVDLSEFLDEVEIVLADMNLP